MHIFKPSLKPLVYLKLFSLHVKLVLGFLQLCKDSHSNFCILTLLLKGQTAACSCSHDETAVRSANTRITVITWQNKILFVGDDGCRISLAISPIDYIGKLKPFLINFSMYVGLTTVCRTLYSRRGYTEDILYTLTYRDVLPS